MLYFFIFLFLIFATFMISELYDILKTAFSIDEIEESECESESECEGNSCIVTDFDDYEYTSINGQMTFINYLTGHSVTRSNDPVLYYKIQQHMLYGG